MEQGQFKERGARKATRSKAGMRKVRCQAVPVLAAHRRTLLRVVCKKHWRAVEHRLTLLQAGTNKSLGKDIKGKGKAAAAAGSMTAKEQVRALVSPLVALCCVHIVACDTACACCVLIWNCSMSLMYVHMPKWHLPWQLCTG